MFMKRCGSRSTLLFVHFVSYAASMPCGGWRCHLPGQCGEELVCPAGPTAPYELAMGDPGALNRELTIRRGELRDLDSLVSLGLASMPMDPQWNYRYPYREAHPDDHRECTSERWERFFHEDPTGGEWVVCFVDYQPEHQRGRAKPAPISFSVWHFPPQDQDALECHRECHEQHVMSQSFASSSSSSSRCESRQDSEPRRMQKFSETIRSEKKKKFETKYGERQIHLQILGTHPDYQRLGAASRLLQWGIEQAHEEEIPITVFASPMGQPLYASVGFEDLGEVTIHVDGEEESVVVVAMTLDPAKR